MSLSYTKPKTVFYNGIELRSFKEDIFRMNLLSKNFPNHIFVHYSTDGDEYSFFMYETSDEDECEDDFFEREPVFKIHLDLHDLITDPVFECENFFIK